MAARLVTDRATVRRWRTRFLRYRLDGLSDEPRPGVPRSITDAQVEEVVVRALEEVPHWSKRELAKRVEISPTSALRIWRAFGLQPWRTEDFKISLDPLLIDKIRDVVGLYLAPPTNAASAQPWVATMLRTVFEQSGTDAVQAQRRHVLDALEAKFPKAAAHWCQPEWCFVTQDEYHTASSLIGEVVVGSGVWNTYAFGLSIHQECGQVVLIGRCCPTAHRLLRSRNDNWGNSGAAVMTGAPRCRQ